MGQTDDFPGRVLTRFMKCEKETLANGKDCVEKRVADLLHSGVVATSQALDYQPTRLGSLVSETSWARKCWNAGYALANRAELQDHGGDPIGRGDIPRGWIDKFTLAQAVADDIEMSVSCSACGANFVILLDAIELERQATTIGQLVNLLSVEPCTFCGVEGKRRVRRWVREAEKQGKARARSTPQQD